MTSTAHVRPAASHDLVPMTAIVRTSNAYHDEYHLHVEHVSFDEKYLSEKVVYVAEKQNTVVGFYSIDKISTSIESEHAAELDFLFVENAHQRKGIGKTLLRHSLATAFDRFRADRMIVVAHPPSRRFYEDAGGTFLCDIAPRDTARWVRACYEFRTTRPQPV